MGTRKYHYVITSVYTLSCYYRLSSIFLMYRANMLYAVHVTSSFQECYTEKV